MSSWEHAWRNKKPPWQLWKSSSSPVGCRVNMAEPEPQDLVGRPAQLQHQWNALFYLISHTKLRVLVGRGLMNLFEQIHVKLRDLTLQSLRISLGREVFSCFSGNQLNFASKWFNGCTLGICCTNWFLSGLILSLFFIVPVFIYKSYITTWFR